MWRVTPRRLTVGTQVMCGSSARMKTASWTRWTLRHHQLIEAELLDLIDPHEWETTAAAEQRGRKALTRTAACSTLKREL